MEKQEEINFVDICASLGRALGRAGKALGNLLGKMVRLSCRYWWIVCTIVVLTLAATIYGTSQSNLIYRMYAVALLNGPSIQQFEQTFASLQSNQRLPENAAISSFLQDKVVSGFTTYRVVDCLGDGTADYIDFKKKSSPTDTVRIQMKDRICLQFRIKVRDMEKMPEIEAALLEFFNSNEAMQRSYKAYMKDFTKEVEFDREQAQRLDSLTAHYYFQSQSFNDPNATIQSGVTFIGERKIHFFLDQIYKQHAHLQRADYRLQLATAPVVLENHFAADKKPINGRLKCLVLFFLLSWSFGCLIAAMLDNRKKISAWLGK